jgi:hypothetical protein
MLREDVLSEYTVNESGVIQTPGKFEGEMLYVPYFWDSYLDGLSDREIEGFIYFKVVERDLENFPELAGADYIALVERDNGFVHASLLSSKLFEGIVRRARERKRKERAEEEAEED